MKIKKNLSFMSSLFFIVFSLYICIESLALNYGSEYGPGPGFLPLWIGGFLLILSIIYMVHAIKKEKIALSEVMPKDKGLRNVIICISSLIGFLILSKYLGFLISSVLLLVLLFKQGYGWAKSIIFSIVVAVIINFAFGGLLNVPLPKNILGF